MLSVAAKQGEALKGVQQSWVTRKQSGHAREGSRFQLIYPAKLATLPKITSETF